MKSFKTLRMVITIVDVVCLLAVLFVPALEAAKHNFFVWLILGLLTRRIFRRNYFLRGISGTGNKISV